MPVKIIELPGIGKVKLHKNARSRNLRISITTDGIRVSMPRWTPYSAAVAFVNANQQWIEAELAKRPASQLISGQAIGKLHNLRFEHIFKSQPASGRVTKTEVIVRLGTNTAEDSLEAQQAAQKAIARALKQEAEQLLPARLDIFAAEFGLSYAGFKVKSLKRRWGSCDSSKRLTFNLYLMELPWEYVDYVLKHELAHTLQMNHGPNFWKQLSSMEPRAKALSKALRKHQPSGSGYNLLEI
ncbi:MAG: SprT family zinc-dependent metalloprotease [Candidatus Saccharimonadales bacterium]